MSLGNDSRPARRSVRLQGYDYRQSGAYFVTICAYQQLCRFGSIRDGKVIANPLGLIVTDCWRKIAQVRPNVELDAFVVMPNHLHGVIIISHDMMTDIAANATRNGRSSRGGLERDSLGGIVGQFKRAVSIKSKSLSQPPGQPLWQRNYYEHIIRNETSLNEIRRYIVHNPCKWHDDSLYVEKC